MNFWQGYRLRNVVMLVRNSWKRTVNPRHLGDSTVKLETISNLYYYIRRVPTNENASCNRPALKPIQARENAPW